MSIADKEIQNPSPEIIDHNHQKMSRADLLSKLISQDLNIMSSKDVSSQAAKHRIDRLYVQINKARTRFDELQTKNEPLPSSDAAAAAPNGESHNREFERDLLLLKKEVSLLKSMFPFSVFKKQDTTHSHINWRDRSTPHSVAAPDKLMQNLTQDSKHTLASDDLKASLRGLKSRSRICLLRFLVFPEDAIIKKSLLVCWAKVHDIEFLDDPIGDLIGNGLIQAVCKDSLTVGGYWMHPYVRSTLIGQNWFRVSDLTECVYVANSNSEEDIIYDDPAHLSAKRDLIILHSGNWQRSSVRHVEVEDPNSFFKDMAKLSKLRYISLRGISLVTEIPEFIMKLQNLEILNLRACHNLEVFPSDIGDLSGSLTHLDMSECYFLDHTPKALSKLRNLQVLKGFFVGGEKMDTSCTIQDLLALEDLTKLNIYTSVEFFPDDHQLSTLKEFKFLRSLTISWGGCSKDRRSIQEEVQPPTPSHGLQTRRDSAGTKKESAFNLEKLDLQCFPESIVPHWLKPTNFKHVKNLYIRGGQLCDLSQHVDKHTVEYQRNVEILRLKHLSKLEMDYSELVKLFPKLICLENVECPNLKHFPCHDGVWKNTTQLPPPNFL